MIRELNQDEFKQAAELSLRVFTQCGTEDFDSEGLDTFKNFIQSIEEINELTIYGSFNRENLVGVLGTKDGGKHISLFFISPQYHRRGLGKELFNFAVHDKPLQEITVNSSSYAIRFYQSLGFETVCEIQETNGLRYTPMKRICIE